MLAEGDVDPAAGSRDEPFKAVGRSPSTKLESQSVCIKLIQGGPASAAGLFQLPTLTNIYRVFSTKESLKKQGAHMDAQRVKTRGPNPNPTAQAQSKRCLPLFTQTQNISENDSISGPIFYQFWYLFHDFCPKVAKRVQGSTQSVQK